MQKNISNNLIYQMIGWPELSNSMFWMATKIRYKMVSCFKWKCSQNIKWVLKDWVYVVNFYTSNLIKICPEIKKFYAFECATNSLTEAVFQWHIITDWYMIEQITRLWCIWLKKYCVCTQNRSVFEECHPWGDNAAALIWFQEERRLILKAFALL